MRKALLFAPMLMLLLTACGGGGEKVDPAAELQAQYAALGSATMEADVICHYAGKFAPIPCCAPIHLRRAQ